MFLASASKHDLTFLLPTTIPTIFHPFCSFQSHLMKEFLTAGIQKIIKHSQGDVCYFWDHLFAGHQAIPIHCAWLHWYTRTCYAHSAQDKPSGWHYTWVCWVMEEVTIANSKCILAMGSWSLDILISHSQHYFCKTFLQGLASPGCEPKTSSCDETALPCPSHCSNRLDWFWSVQHRGNQKLLEWAITIICRHCQTLKICLLLLLLWLEKPKAHPGFYSASIQVIKCETFCLLGDMHESLLWCFTLCLQSQCAWWEQHSLITPRHLFSQITQNLIWLLHLFKCPIFSSPGPLLKSSTIRAWRLFCF